MSAEGAFYNNFGICKYVSDRKGYCVGSFGIMPIFYFRKLWQKYISATNGQNDIKEHSNNKVIINYGKPKFTKFDLKDNFVNNYPNDIRAECKNKTRMLADFEIPTL